MHPHHHHSHHHHTLHAPRGRHHEGGGPEHGPGHHHGPDHALRRERVFEAGGLKLIALHLIAKQPSHGYDVIRAIGELVGGDYTPSPGTIYPTLSYLVDMGHATSTDMEGGRKQYSITTEGQQALQEQDEALQHLLGRLAKSKARQAGQRPPALVRALENFKTALRLKMEHGTADGKLIDEIASIIDQAALKIEKA